MKEIKIPYIYDKTKFHKLVYESDELWSFHVAEDWMPLTLGYESNNVIKYIDADGMGSPICVGDKIKGMTVDTIIESDNKFLIKLI